MAGERGIKLYNKNFREEDINEVQPGDIIVYENEGSLDGYLVVSAVDVEKKEISGQIASTIGVNCVPLEQMVNFKK